MDAQGLYAIRPRVSRWDAWEIAEDVQDSSLIRRLFEVFRAVRIVAIATSSLIEQGLGVSLLLGTYWSPNPIYWWDGLADVVTVTRLLDHVALFDLLWANDFNLFVGHIVIVLVCLHFVGLVALAGHASSTRVNWLLRCRGLSSRVLIPLAESIACLDLWDLNLLNLLLATVAVTGEVLTPSLIASLIDIWNLFPSAFRLITDISIGIAIFICIVSSTIIRGWLVLMLNIHHEFLLFGRLWVFRQCDFLLGNDAHLALVYSGWIVTLLFFLLLSRDGLGLWGADWIQMVCHESVGKLIPGNGHRQ